MCVLTNGMCVLTNADRNLSCFISEVDVIKLFCYNVKLYKLYKTIHYFIQRTLHYRRHFFL